MTTNVAPIESSELFDVLNYAPVGVLIEDCAGRIVWLNHTLEWQLGIVGNEVLGAHTSALPIEPLPGARGKRLFRTLRDVGCGLARNLKCIEDILPEYSQSGIRVRYFLEAHAQESQPKSRNDRLSMLVDGPTVDRGTGLPNRHAITHTLSHEVSRSRRYGNPLSVVVVRIDTVRPSGVVLDHPSRLMAAASRLLKDGTRWADSVGRLDDWEFMLVLPETTGCAALQLVRKIEPRVEDAGTNGGVSFSVRFGVAEWRRGDDEGTLSRRARESVCK